VPTWHSIGSASLDCAAHTLCSTRTVQYIHCAVHTLCSTHTVQHTHCAAHTLCSTHTVQYTHCAVHTLCSTHTVQYTHCAVHTLCSTHTHHGVSPILYFHYICFLYTSCCFGLNLILNQTPNLSNYTKYAAITPTTSMSTDTIEPLL